MGDLARDRIRKWERGKTDRVTFDTLWQQTANVSFPNRSDYITTKTPGQKRMQYIYDSSPVWMTEQHAAGIHSLLTSTSLQWGWLRTEDDRLNADQECRAWLDDTSMTMFSLFSSAKLNFAAQSYEVFLDTGSIGQACMGVLDGATGPLFTTRHMKECVLFENDEDRIDGNIRQWQWTARQAFERWGAAAGPAVYNAYSKGDEERKLTFLHSVLPRQKRDPQRADKQNMAWESLYICVDDATEIAEGGFREFAYACPRFSRASGETYGRGPGTVALPDVQMLNELVKLVLKSAQKIIDPPLQVPDDGFLMAIKTLPGSINYYRASSQNKIEPVTTNGNVPIGLELLNALKAQIARTYYVDMLRMPVDPNDPASEGKGITATYWLQRREKEMMMLSPVVARMQSEFCDPVFDRVFAMQMRKSIAKKFGPGSPFKPPPQKLAKAKLRVEYVSPLALAQKSTQMDAVTRLLQFALQIRQIDPQAPVIIDFDYAQRLAGRDWNAPAQLLLTPEQVAAAQQKQAAAEAAMNAHAALANVASAAKDGSVAAKNLGLTAQDNEGAEAA